MSLVPYRSGRVGTYPHIVDRGKPGLIAVLSNGKRFVNEADGYYQFTAAMIAAAPADEEVAAWLICDHAFQRRYPFGMSKPFPMPVWPYVRSGYLKRGRTLERTRAEMRHRPRRTDQHRRIVQHSTPPSARIPNSVAAPARSTAAPATPTTSPTRRWRPIEKGPFYAIKVLPGSFGTFAGTEDRPDVPRARQRRASPLPACTPQAATRPT